MNTLAIDFGLKKIGIAFSEGMLARPLAVIPNNEKTVDTIKKLCSENAVEKIVIGRPEGEIGKQALFFGGEIANRLMLPIVFQPEILTTKEAIAKMIHSGKSKKYRREMEDAFSAALLLEDYLEKIEELRKVIN